MQMDQLYQEIILDHYRSPHHRGLRVPYGAEVHHVNPVCGDEVTLRVDLHRDSEGRNGDGVVGSGDFVVGDVSYDAVGCSISQAATSVMADLVIGQSVPQALGLLDEFTDMVTSRGTIAGDENTLGDGVAFAGVAKYPSRVKCALLGWMAFKDAVAQTITGAGTAGSGQTDEGARR